MATVSLSMSDTSVSPSLVKLWKDIGHLMGLLNDLLFNMRSSDAFLGTPWNITFYALLLHMIAQITNHAPNELLYSGCDVHIYSNHIEQVKEQLTRVPFTTPTLELNKDVTDIFQFKYEDIKLMNYISHPAIKAEIAV